MNATVRQLEAELLALISSLPTFKNKAFSAYDLENLEAIAEWQSGIMPVVGVAYNGSVPVGNSADPKSKGASSVQLGSFQFIVIMAVQYGTPGQTDTKQDAMGLLDELRTALVGYKNINSRSWRWMGERPEPEASGDGIIFYSQLWETNVPIVGTAINS